MITQEELKLIVYYDYIDGSFIQLVNTKLKKCGDKIGFVRKDGYIYVTVNGKQYLGHRLAWMYYYGYWPNNQIDHINGIRSDNRIENLRQATDAQNKQNYRNSHKDSISQYIGVTYHKLRSKWQAQIAINGKQCYLGLFNTEIEAHNAYLTAKRENHAFCTI